MYLHVTPCTCNVMSQKRATCGRSWRLHLDPLRLSMFCPRVTYLRSRIYRRRPAFWRHHRCGQVSLSQMQEMDRNGNLWSLKISRWCKQCPSSTIRPPVWPGKKAPIRHGSHCMHCWQLALCPLQYLELDGNPDPFLQWQHVFFEWIMLLLARLSNSLVTLWVAALQSGLRSDWFDPGLWHRTQRVSWSNWQRQLRYPKSSNDTISDAFPQFLGIWIWEAKPLAY